MKPATNFLSKIWVFAFLSSILFKYFSPEGLNHPFKMFLLWLIFLLPTLFAFIKYGTAILINSEMDKILNYRKELFKLALFIFVNIWIINFFIFTLLGNLNNYHFYTVPFLSAMIIGIYFFQIENEQEFQSESILDDDLDLKK